jgi:polyisoprenoid-binding protein YceI
MKTSFAFAAAVAACITGPLAAAPANYSIDPDHTFPSFEADHMGISVWRGKMNRSTGSLTFDKTTGAGSVDVTVELASIDFGHDALNRWARSAEFFDVEKHPVATYKGRFEGASNGAPAQVVGELTLNGVSKPVVLKINSLKCVPHPMLKRELCGADASGSFKRDDFNLDMGKAYGFKMDVTLRIQVEALQVQ